MLWKADKCLCFCDWKPDHGTIWPGSTANYESDTRSNMYLARSYVFLSVAKDFAKRWADMALLYNMASHRSTGGFNYFVGGNHHPAKRNR